MKATPPLLLSLSGLLPLHTDHTLATSGVGRDDSSQLTLLDTADARLASESRKHGPAQDGTVTALDPLPAIRDAVEVMQDKWFELWVGTWPTAIDWTAAVADTHLVASLNTLSKALNSTDTVGEPREVENELGHYFSQNAAYYFGEDAFSLRNQAYDDMLWVVLGWLESIKFTSSHSSRHYSPVTSSNPNDSKPWQGAQFIPSFAHRARIFYDLSANGWDDTLCGGGMVWNPYLAPYKNAITNELFISASVGMYLHFPGDNNTSPFSSLSSPGQPHNPTYLNAAIKGYDWFRTSGLRSARGLYTDGFHISRYRSGGTTCDVRNDMLYTYNQGVLLSGLRDLWEATGNTSYLLDAHELVRSVIRATGWVLDTQALLPGPEMKAWHGLGRNGILEERCDADASCSQDAQTFKGIFFHHLALLCQPLPLEAAVPGRTFGASREIAWMHRTSCGSYAVWVARNAERAMGSRDGEGKFGGWWGGGEEGREGAPTVGGGEVDYRNDWSELRDPLWLQEELEVPVAHRWVGAGKQGREPRLALQDHHDPNERGRGRTVETQTGGIAVLRALWEVLHQE